MVRSPAFRPGTHPISPTSSTGTDHDVAQRPTTRTITPSRLLPACIVDDNPDLRILPAWTISLYKTVGKRLSRQHPGRFWSTFSPSSTYTYTHRPRGRQSKGLAPWYHSLEALGLNRIFCILPLVSRAGLGSRKRKRQRHDKAYTYEKKRFLTSRFFSPKERYIDIQRQRLPSPLSHPTTIASSGDSLASPHLNSLWVALTLPTALSIPLLACAPSAADRDFFPGQSQYIITGHPWFTTTLVATFRYKGGFWAWNVFFAACQYGCRFAKTRDLHAEHRGPASTSAWRPGSSAAGW